MAGRDESAKLQGMLSELAGTVGEMGAGRDWGANAIRQIARPDNQAMFRGQPYALDNSANLLQMGQWAERNGFDDKSRQYMALADRYQQREIEEEKAKQLSEAQLGVSKIITQMQSVATDKSLPTADRMKEVARLSEKAKTIAAAGRMNPMAVVNPTNEFLTYIQTADANSSAASLLTQGNDLKREIRLALAANEPVKAERLLAQFNAVSAQANALGDPDLVDQIDEGIGIIIDKMPDAIDGQRESRAARAFELYLNSGDENDPRGTPLLADDKTKELYRKKIAEHEAAGKAEEKLEADLANIRLRNQKLQSDLATAEQEGTLIPATQFAALKEAGEYDKYFTAWTNMADAPFRRQQLNKDMRARNSALQKMQDDSLKEEAAMYVLEAPRFIEQMETDGWDMTKDLDNWVETYASTITDDKTVDMLAKVIVGDPRFPEATPEERKQIALERVITHLLATDEYFSEAFKANEDNKARKTKNKVITLEENEAEWRSVNEGGVKVNTYPDHPNGYYKRVFEETNNARKRESKEPYTEEEFLKIYTGKYKEDVVSANAPRGIRGGKVETDLATHLFPNRRSGSQTNRQPAASDNSPSILDRQRANLSPPIGPMGDPEDYETKLRKARQALPNSPYQGSFLTEFPETAPPYIDPRYRNFGG